MTRRAYHLTFGLLAVIAVASLMTATYSIGKNGSKDAAGNAAPATKTKILLGRIVRIEPLHLYVESASLGPTRTYDVLISPQTKYLQLTAWAPDEREKAIEEYGAYMEKQHPMPGEPIPSPPQQLKPLPLDPSALIPGMMVGIGSSEEITDGEPIVSAVIRPLTSEEASTGRVANTFPL